MGPRNWYFPLEMAAEMLTDGERSELFLGWKVQWSAAQALVSM